MPQFETLHAILPADAREDRQITFIEGEQDQRTLSFRRLRQRAIGALGALQRRGLSRGDMMILYLGDNERFVEMFWACVLGGIVPVPLAPGGNDEHWRKLLRVFAQLERASVCIDAPALERFDAFVASQGLEAEGGYLRSRTVMAASLDMAGEPGLPSQAQPEDIAFIQYSSGSTGEPKGVLLTHRNLTTNAASIIEGAAYTDRDSVLTWMPLSHDMGLIGFHLTLLAGGITHAIMRTDLFARRPLLWLELASQRRSTVLCSPNFGFQHYLRQFDIKSPQGLDLSSIRLIFNGAEPISTDLCRRFMRTMAPHGLKPNSMFPVYGLAEATLAVSFSHPGAPLETIKVGPASLRLRERVDTVTAEAGRLIEYAKLGPPLPGVEVRIVDDNDNTLDERVLGHVHMRGDNVTQGYYRNEKWTAEVLSADGWLDTGDLGLLWDGQLVITGRAKDLIIINGMNHYPQDLERIAEQVEGIEANRVAAAGVQRSETDSEELAFFVLHRGDIADFAPKAFALRQAILQQSGLEATHVVPVRQIPKTSSGKLQRYALAESLVRGEFDGVLAELAPLLSACNTPETAEQGSAQTINRLLNICGGFVTDRKLTPQTNLLDINLNSLTLARIHEAIEREFPQRIEVTDLFDYPTLERLAEFMDTPGT
ncbi:MAG: non-ribosomal peptide synthetase [Burkholderiaceae bacterium]|nr:non-ribosomal peptide synthetase [Burkholderiaceae bacterium]